METNDVYNYLNTPGPLSDKKRLLREYLLNQAQQYRMRTNEPQRIAYTIAGLLSTQTAMELARNDPYVKIMDMAATLELPVEYHGSVSWESLVSLIAELPAEDQAEA